jgi:hypothetical protein
MVATNPTLSGVSLAMSTLQQFFSSAELSPHGFCLLWRPELLWLHVVSDTLIGVAYYTIPLALVYFVRKREDIVFGWVFWMFGAFILACGTTHWFEVWTLWHADYAMQGLIKGVTAGLSIATALLLWPLLPQALALPSPASCTGSTRSCRCRSASAIPRSRRCSAR